MRIILHSTKLRQSTRPALNVPYQPRNNSKPAPTRAARTLELLRVVRRRHEMRVQTRQCTELTMTEVTLVFSSMTVVRKLRGCISRGSSASGTACNAAVDGDGRRELERMDGRRDVVAADARVAAPGLNVAGNVGRGFEQARAKGAFDIRGLVDAGGVVLHEGEG